MIRRYLLLMLGSLALLSRPYAKAVAPPPPFVDPVHGTIFSGHILAGDRKEWPWLKSSIASLNNNVPLTHVRLATSDCIPPRFHVAYGAIWVATASALMRPYNINQCFEGLERYEMSSLLRGELCLIPGKKQQEDSSDFAYPVPAGTTRRLGTWMHFIPSIHYDHYPTGPFSVRHFLLTDVRGQLRQAGKTDQLVGIQANVSLEEAKTPKWSFGVHSYSTKWDDKKNDWQEGKWEKIETIEVVFKEAFRSMIIGDDYYFLTLTGKLYRSPKPKKGTHRQLEVVWDGADPITAFITDADSSKIYLFCDKGIQRKIKPLLFELAPKADVRTYDPELYKPGNEGPELLRRSIGYARVLSALKLIKTEPPVIKKKDK